MPYFNENEELFLMELYIPTGMTVEKVQAILTVLPGNRNKDYVKAANLMIEKILI